MFFFFVAKWEDPCNNCNLKNQPRMLYSRLYSEGPNAGICLPGDSFVVPLWFGPIFLLGVVIYYPRRNYLGVFRYCRGLNNYQHRAHDPDWSDALLAHGC